MCRHRAALAPLQDDYASHVIDDGPVFKLAIGRAVKRFELDAAAWPRPPRRGGDDWEAYWRWRFEAVLFSVGLGVRKLIEAGKLSLEVQSRPIDVMSAPLVSARVPDVLNLHRADEFYDLESAQPFHIPLVKLCHSIVHSYVLLPTFAYSGPSGLQLHDFLLASDRGRRERAYFVNWSRFVSTVVEPVVSDEVIEVRHLRTGQGDELRMPLSTPRLMSMDTPQLVQLYTGMSKENAGAVKEFAKRFVDAWGRPHPGLPPEGKP